MKIFAKALLGVFAWMACMYIYAVKISGSNAGVNMAVFFSSLFLFIIYILWAAGIIDILRIRIHSSRLIAKGITANAMILSCRKTGLKVTQSADFPRYGVEIEAEVKTADGDKFIARTTVLLAESRIGSLKAGMPVRVYYDPEKKNEIAIDME